MPEDPYENFLAMAKEMHKARRVAVPKLKSGLQESQLDDEEAVEIPAPIAAPGSTLLSHQPQPPPSHPTPHQLKYHPQHIAVPVAKGRRKLCSYAQPLSHGTNKRRRKRRQPNAVTSATAFAAGPFTGTAEAMATSLIGNNQEVMASVAEIRDAYRRRRREEEEESRKLARRTQARIRHASLPSSSVTGCEDEEPDESLQPLQQPEKVPQPEPCPAHEAEEVFGGLVYKRLCSDGVLLFTLLNSIKKKLRAGSRVLLGAEIKDNEGDGDACRRMLKMLYMEVAYCCHDPAVPQIYWSAASCNFKLLLEPAERFSTRKRFRGGELPDLRRA
ncbi:unnamed protein product [Chrysoparadoxa australica]